MINANITTGSTVGTCDFGLIGLAVMGQNLVLNIARHGYRVAVFNRTTSVTEEFLAGPARSQSVVGATTLAEFVGLIKRPRKIQLMVKAGQPVDAVIEQLLPYLEAGDLIIDGGNSYFKDTERREQALREKGIAFFGMGVSGGEEGALWGPSLMPGGDPQAYALVEPLLKDIAAKAPDGSSCVTYLGPRGAGHYVKMVHNGIEYGDMQLIAESYDLLKRVAGLSDAELGEVFTAWNTTELNSFLIEITAHIFKVADDQQQQGLLLNYILDSAAQKGTGKWTSQEALDLGVPIPTLVTAVESRFLSALYTERRAASQVLHGPQLADGTQLTGQRTNFIEAVRQALYCSKVCSYAQGMALLKVASDTYGYNIPLGQTAAIWRAGCIIRAAFLGDITQAYVEQPDLPNLMLAERFRAPMARYQESWRWVVAEAIRAGVPSPAFSASLAYYDGYRSARLPANLIQAQRDLFGAHTFERIDRPAAFHANWGYEIKQ